MLKIIVLIKQLTIIVLLLAAFPCFGQKVIRIKDLTTTADLKSFEVARVHIDTLPPKYTVKYDLVERISMPTEFTKTTDMFGRVTYDTHAVYRYKEYLDHREKSFSNREEAFRFYEAAKREYDIKNVVIDSMYYKIVLD